MRPFIGGICGGGIVAEEIPLDKMHECLVVSDPKLYLAMFAHWCWLGWLNAGVVRL